MDADPLVWTNQRFIRWARAIDLVEYADNLKGNKLKINHFFNFSEFSYIHYHYILQIAECTEV